ncbi:MAG: SDR family oxidoreductase [Acidimicrobiia bacterium]|nr:SDR family oxidoreductase [Acidimicrobiia bacterium]
MVSRFVKPEDRARVEDVRFQLASRSLAGKVVLVPGGTGGLGSCLVALLLAERAVPVAGYRSNRERAERIKSLLESKLGGTVHLVEGDLREEHVRRHYLAEAARHTGSIDGMACFVGDPARVPSDSLTADDLARSCATNFIAPVLLAKAVGEQMIARKVSGSLVLLSSMQGVAAFENSLNYAAPKAALIHANRVLAKEWSGQSVQVNVVAPGATVAGMAASSVSSGKYDRYIEQGAVSRFGQPEDIARAVRFLLEPDCYITGQVLLVDGGMGLRA